jgi:hypothetical protein
MKSRRRIAFPLGQDYADPAVQLPKQSRKSRATEWGPTVVLQRKRFVAPAILDGDILALDESGFRQALLERIDQDAQSWRPQCCAGTSRAPDKG